MVFSHPNGCHLLLNKIWCTVCDGKVVLGYTGNLKKKKKERSDMPVEKHCDFTFNNSGRKGITEVLVFKYLSLDQRFSASLSLLKFCLFSVEHVE